MRRERRSTSGCASGSARSPPCSPWPSSPGRSPSPREPGQERDRRRAAGPCPPTPAGWAPRPCGPRPTTDRCCSPRPGVSLDDSVDTRNNLLATLDRAPALVGSARSAGRIFSMAVNPATGQVAVMAADGVGLELYDGPALRRVSAAGETRRAGRWSRALTGRATPCRSRPTWSRTSVEPPVLLLDPDRRQVRGPARWHPARYHVFDNSASPRRWYLGYSPTVAGSPWPCPDFQRTGPHSPFVWDLQSPRQPVAVRRARRGGERSDDQPGRAHPVSREPPPTEDSLLVTDLPSGTTRRTLSAEDLGVRRLDDVLAQSPDGRTLAVGAGVEAVLVDTATLNAPSAPVRAGRHPGLAFSPDGTHVAASGDRLMVWDVSGNDPVEVLAQDGRPRRPRVQWRRQDPLHQDYRRPGPGLGPRRRPPVPRRRLG